MTSLRHSSRFIRNLVSSVILAVGLAGNADATVTFQYTGNPFDAALTTSTLLEKHIVASVTFNNAVTGLTGTVDSTEIVSWSIEIDQVAGTIIDSVTGSTNSNFPLWFGFDSGSIIDWQLLAQPAINQIFPEIFTTHNSPYSYIAPTCDFYVTSGSLLVGQNINAPGTWQLTTSVPEPNTMLLLGFGLIGLAGFRVKFKNLIRRMIAKFISKEGD